MNNPIATKHRPDSSELSPLERRLADIEYWPIAQLEPYERNARRHPEQQLRRLAASIKEFGFALPVLAAPDGSVICGHARIKAARRVGLQELPVLIAAGWSEAQIRAFRLADNRLAELGEWDNEILSVELSAVIELDEVPIDVLGWGAEDIELAAGDPNTDDPVAAAKPARAPADQIARLDDAWWLGRHQLLCEAAREIGKECAGGRGAVDAETDIFLSCVDEALRRWESLTGTRALLAATGESFVDVAQRRNGNHRGGGK
jgi:hypothetical protein